jgi:hypothetical protein
LLNAQQRANELAEKQLTATNTLISILATDKPVKSVSFTTLQAPEADKVSPKVQAIIQWLETHPDKAELPSRKIADLIGGVSHTLVSQAKQRIQ